MFGNLPFWLFLIIIFLLIDHIVSVHGNEGAQKKHSPNILFVLVDDLGWGDVGYHYTTNTSMRSEIKTPGIDRLAKKQGIELNRHYVHSSCTGTRTSLQSGRLPVHVQTGLANPEDPSSGMPRNLTGLAEHMLGYRRHYVGKWDVGMATRRHTPMGRGYDTSLNYFEHKNDYWTQECMQSACCSHNSQWDSTGSGSSAKSGKIFDLWDTDRPARRLVDQGVYEEFIFQERMLNIIDDHAADYWSSNNTADSGDQAPLFLFYAPHLAHCPLQVPKLYLDQFDFIDDDSELCQAQTPNIFKPNDDPPPRYSCRKQYRAMVKLLDDILGSLVHRLEQHGMWNNTLMVFTTDNGGPTLPEESGATNWPLRGGKYSDWEGGVRATAFVSGGYIPKGRMGAVVNQNIHIADWYATLPALAGVDVLDGESKARHDDPRIPAVDAVNVWSVIMGDYEVDSAKTPPRTEIPLSATALIIGDYKLMWGDRIRIAGYTYPDYPKANTTSDEIRNKYMDCSNGCLFNIREDPGEHFNIGNNHKSQMISMMNRLVELRKGFFENNDTGVDSCPRGYNDDDEDLLCACWMAINYYGGFFGPFQEVDLKKPYLLGGATVDATRS